MLFLSMCQSDDYMNEDHIGDFPFGNPCIEIRKGDKNE